MSKNTQKRQTIDNGLTDARALLKSGAYEQAREALDALSQRRLNKAQANEHAMLVEALQDEAPAYSMASHIAQYRARYTACHTASGNKSLNNGDALAAFLEGKEPMAVCALADQWTPIKGGQTHQERYERLNPGQQRMNAGNKLRAAAKNGMIIVGKNGIEAA